MDALFGLDGDRVCLYADPRRSINKRVVTRGGQIIGVRLAGEVQAQGWIKEAIAEGAAGERCPGPLGCGAHQRTASALPARRKVVCQCADVSEAQINKGLAQGSSLVILQATLKCGTYCGYCMPELKRLAARAPERMEMGFAHYIKEIGRGAEGSRSLSQDARRLYGGHARRWCIGTRARRNSHRPAHERRVE